MHGAPVRCGSGPRLAPERPAQGLPAAEPALLRDASKIGFTRAQKGHRAANSSPSKKDRRRGSAELGEAGACPLSGSTDRSGKAGDPCVWFAGLQEVLAQERIGKHPEPAPVAPANIIDVAAQPLHEEGLAQTGDDRRGADLPERHLLAQGLEAGLERSRNAARTHPDESRECREHRMAEGSADIDPGGNHLRGMRFIRCPQCSTPGSVDDQQLSLVEAIARDGEIGVDETQSLEDRVERNRILGEGPRPRTRGLIWKENAPELQLVERIRENVGGRGHVRLTSKNRARQSACLALVSRNNLERTALVPARVTIRNVASG